MGRVTGASGRRGVGRHGIVERPILLLGLLIVLPAVGFGALGWRSVEREADFDRRDARRETADLVRDRIRALADELRAVEGRENTRPYYHYQQQFAPEETAFQELDFQPSPLTRAPEDPRILGYFQFELAATGVPELPETFGPGTDRLRQTLADTYGGVLRTALAKAGRTTELERARLVEHPLRVVQANEERGKLFEELQIAKQQRQQQRKNKPQAGQADGSSTPYLQDFYARIGNEPMGIEIGPFHYAAREDRLPGPPLVAWRLVRIPASHAGRREVDRDRWLLQGYALDPGRDLPEAWETVGRARIVRADHASEADRAAPDAALAGVAEALGATVVGAAGARPEGGASLTLTLLGRPDADALAALAATARARFLWLLAGVLVVVGVGFFVLTRGVRREIALARRKEDFVAAVTHELKTPLAGIRMYADMVREGWVADASSAERYASRILEETERLGHLVDQVLDLAALERGVARASAVHGDLGAAVREAVALVAARAADAGVDLSVETSDDIPPVPFDPRLVRPLVLNLVDNAIKYSAKAPVKSVRVAVRREGREAVLVVSDRGPGIEPSVRRHLFEPFRRAGNELTRDAPGVGIGLALVKRYADAHGARVGVESGVGGGTRVTLRFPL